jgi:hypothetical protein
VGVSTELREFAEEPERYVEQRAGSSVEKSDDGRRCIIRDRTWATITGIRVDIDDIDDLIGEVEWTLSPECEALWHIGPSSTPVNLCNELERRGLGPPAHRPREVRALALDKEPEAQPAADVRRLESFEQFVAARELGWESFGTPEERRAIERPQLRQGFEEMKQTGIFATFLAYVDERLAGSAIAVPSKRGVLLGGGSVAPWARGRGLYRAMVHARWEYAKELMLPGLVTHANLNTSLPILLRLGFEEVGTVHRLQRRVVPDGA